MEIEMSVTKLDKLLKFINNFVKDYNDVLNNSYFKDLVIYHKYSLLSTNLEFKFKFDEELDKDLTDINILSENIAIIKFMVYSTKLKNYENNDYSDALFFTVGIDFNLNEPIDSFSCKIYSGMVDFLPGENVYCFKANEKELDEFVKNRKSFLNNLLNKITLDMYI